jgi:hypothetical protein
MQRLDLAMTHGSVTISMLRGVDKVEANKFNVSTFNVIIVALLPLVHIYIERGELDNE